jgi:hypothetical protein
MSRREHTAMKSQSGLFPLAAEKSRVLPIFPTEAMGDLCNQARRPFLVRRSAVFTQNDRRELRARFIGRVPRHTT